MSKYEPICQFLVSSASAEKRMTFGEIETVLGFPLPPSARRHRPWWSNNLNNSVMTRAWLDAGYKTEQVDMAGEVVVFKKFARPSGPSGFSPGLNFEGGKANQPLGMKDAPGADPFAPEPKARMTVDEFLAWAEHRAGRHELVNGEVFPMSPERARHAETKAVVYMALLQAVRRAGVAGHVLPDGLTVRIDRGTAYEPDALVYCGPRLDGDAVEVPRPVIVVEVLSPGTRSIDAGGKLQGYFQVASLQHYLIVDPESRVVTHHRRGADLIETRTASDGALRMDPPGIEVTVADLFPEP